VNSQDLKCGESARLTANDMRVLREMEHVLLPSLGGNGDCDGFMPHGARDWTAIRRLWSEQRVEPINDFATCQMCRYLHEGQAFVLTHWGMRELGIVRSCQVYNAIGELK